VATSLDPAVPYAFSNSDPDSVDRHSHLTSILDELTVSRLSGLGDLTGRRCLEIGAGGGSVARWLAHRAAPGGRVLATDVDTRHLPPDAGYQVLQHNIATDPVPDGGWDLIHARAVLMHVPQRRQVLARLAAALAPGGVLVIEDMETSFRKLVLAAPDDEARRLVDRYQELLIERIMPANGNDSAWAGQVHAAMLDCGLSDVDTLIQARSWPGGSPGAALNAVNIAQLRDRFLAAGMTAAELDRLCELLTTDPRLVIRGHLVYSTIGRKP
jgi:SAM-dependent methyltransferase